MDLATIEAQLVGGGGDQPVSTQTLIWLARIIRNQFANVQAQFATDEAAGQQLAARVTALEQTPAVTMTVVASAGALPANAPPTQFFRVVGDPAVYIGNGAANPLTKLVPA